MKNAEVAIFEPTYEWKCIAKSGMDTRSMWKWYPEAGLTERDIVRMQRMAKENRIFMAQKKVGNSYHLVVKLNRDFKEIADKQGFMKPSESVVVQKIYTN